MNKQQALDKYCPMKLSAMGRDSLVLHDLLCHADGCMAWREEICPACSGKGHTWEKVTVEKNGLLVKENKEIECEHCDGSGVHCYCGMVSQ